MDPERARELLARERGRIEQALGLHTGRSPEESDENREPGEEGSENLYQDERQELAAVDRAEARLEAGTYGLSILSGDPIPDGRLEARPTAELTVEEQQHA
jgi:DnaK suppressor protein